MAQFEYIVTYIGSRSPDDDEEVIVTREQVMDKLKGWTIDPELSILDLENSPGEDFRLSAFAFYRAEVC